MGVIDVLVRAHIADFRQEGRHHLPVIITGIPFNLPDDLRRLQYAVHYGRKFMAEKNEKRRTGRKPIDHVIYHLIIHLIKLFFDDSSYTQ